jgi:hypothetical protein
LDLTLDFERFVELMSNSAGSQRAKRYRIAGRQAQSVATEISMSDQMAAIASSQVGSLLSPKDTIYFSRTMLVMHALDVTKSAKNK